MKIKKRGKRENGIEGKDIKSERARKILRSGMRMSVRKERKEKKEKVTKK